MVNIFTVEKKSDLNPLGMPTKLRLFSKTNFKKSLMSVKSREITQFILLSEASHFSLEVVLDSMNFSMSSSLKISGPIRL